VSYLIDTNIISELRKGAHCDAHVGAWYASIADEDLFLSTLVLGEIRKGVELARPRDAGKAAALERWAHPRHRQHRFRSMGPHERRQTRSGHRWPARGDRVDQWPNPGDAQ
jgi:predicted nucleic acid-binding protein